MTVLIGILCNDGIVIASDSASTFGTQGFHTIGRQPTQKVFHLEKAKIPLIFAGTGEVGLIQRFQKITEDHLASHLGPNTDIEALNTAILTKVALDFKSTMLQIPSQVELGCLMGTVVKGKLSLVEFASGTLQPEIKSSQWYVSMGIGQIIADSFLGFLRKVIWKDGLPSVEDGITAAVWTIYQTIELNTGGVDGPIQVAIIESYKQSYLASKLDQEAVDTALEHVKDIEKRIPNIWANDADHLELPLSAPPEK